MIKSFKDPIYKVKITFVYEESDDYIERLQKKLNVKFTGITEETGGFCAKIDSFHYVLCTYKFPDCLEATIAHEAFHIVCSVLKDKGLKLSDSSEEAYTHYLHYIVSECIKITKKRCKVGERVRMNKKMTKDLDPVDGIFTVRSIEERFDVATLDRPCWEDGGCEAHINYLEKVK